MANQSKSLDQPEETREFDNGKLDLVEIAGSNVGRSHFKPGWRWSEAVKPIVGTDSCEIAHVGYAVSGQIHVVTDDGTELDIKAGDAYELAPGHDAWVVGDEPVVVIDITGMGEYAKSG